MGVKPLADWLQQRHATVHMARWMLEFDDPAVEREFRRFDDDAGLRPARFAIVVGLLLHGGYAVAEPFLFTEGVGAATLVRVVTGFVPFVIIGTAFRRSVWAQRHLQQLLVVLVSLSILGFAISAEVTPFPTEYVRNACVIGLLGTIGITRLRLRAALALAAVFVLANAFIGLVRSDDGAILPSHVAPAAGLTVVGILMAYALERLRRTDFASQREAEQERRRSDELLHSILPVPIADRLRTTPGAIAESADQVSVLFSDIVGFTPLSESLPPEDLVQLLDALFSEFDALCEERNVEKIKTVGDAYMVVAGIPHPDPDHAASLADLALAMQRSASRLSGDWPTPLVLRIGISSGPVVAGVIGRRKFAYDLWGDTVNTASRMESHGVPGRIQVSAATHALLRGRYAFDAPRGIEVKGKGTLQTYDLLGPTGADVGRMVESN